MTKPAVGVKIRKNSYSLQNIFRYLKFNCTELHDDVSLLSGEKATLTRIHAYLHSDRMLYLQKIGCTNIASIEMMITSAHFSTCSIPDPKSSLSASQSTFRASNFTVKCGRSLILHSLSAEISTEQSCTSPASHDSLSVFS